MAKQQRRPQTPKGLNLTRVMRVQDIRRSNAAGIHGVDGYDRNEWRNRFQRGIWED